MQFLETVEWAGYCQLIILDLNFLILFQMDSRFFKIDHPIKVFGSLAFKCLRK